MWIKRKAEALIDQYKDQFPVILVTGARQVGKTSILRHMFPDITYVTLDDPAQSARAENSPEEFLSGLKTPAIIDEVQYVTSLFRYIKLSVDKNKQKGIYFLTGSQNFGLMQNVSESLSGRCGIVNLHTLSAEEINKKTGKLNLEEFITKGGFPALYSDKTIKPSFWYPSYIATYLERDVRNVLSVTSLRDFNRFLRAISLRTAQIISFSDIANDIGISPNTVKSWLSVLQTSNLVYLLEPYHKNIGKRLVKSPKLYFCDTGLVIHLMGMQGWKEIEKTPVAGAVWETYVFSQLYKHFNNLGLNNPPLWFWRTKEGHEVDFLIEKGGRFIAIESKLAGSPSMGDIKSFEYLKSYYGEKSFIKGILSCKTGKSYPLGKDITVNNMIDLESLI